MLKITQNHTLRVVEINAAARAILQRMEKTLTVD
jgi:hypothetical protein